MADQKRVTFAIASEQAVMLQGTSNYKGSAAQITAPIGYVTAGESPSGVKRLFRDLQKYPIEWPTDIFQIVDAWVDLYGQFPAEGFGGTPRVKIGRAGSDFVESGTDPDNFTDNGTEDATNWSDSDAPVSPIVTSTSGLGTGLVRIKIPGIIEAIAPTTVKKRDGTASGGATDHGLVVYSADDGSETTTNRWGFRTKNWSDSQYRPTLTIIYISDIAPGVPTVLSPAPSTTGTIVPSVDAKRLTVDLITNVPAQRVQVEVYANGATAVETDPGTQPVTGTLVAFTGAITPTATGQTNRYTASLTGLVPRLYHYMRVRAQSAKGTWGRWTELAQGRIFPAYTPLVPIDPRMTTDPSGPVISATLNSQDPQDGVTGLTGIFLRHNVDGSTTNLWPSLDTIAIGYVAGVKRASVDWRGIGLNDGDRVSWRVALLNRDGVLSPLTPEVTTVMRSPIGPTITPADATTKLTSRRTGVTLDDPIEFDGYRYRLYRNDILYYSSPTIGIDPAATTADITFPAGVLNWGDTFGIEAETRPTGDTPFGPTSARVVLYVDTLPSSTLTATDEDGVGGAVLGTKDVWWRAPYSDPDALRYGDVPVAKILELRSAAAVPETGTLREYRMGVAALLPIPEDEETGKLIDALDSASAGGTWTSNANVSVGTAATAPTGWTGNSLQVAFASSSSTRGTRLTFAEPLDLSHFSSNTLMSLRRRVTSATNIGSLRIRIESSDFDYLEYEIATPSTTINTWATIFPTFGLPTLYAGSPDLTAIRGISIFVFPTGAYAGNLQLREWSLGTFTGTGTAENHPQWEESYAARVQYRDDADVLVDTTLAAGITPGVAIVKVTSTTGLLAGQLLTLGSETGLQETRRIVAVGTAGSGGTGITLDAPTTYTHWTSSTPARVWPWGPETAWRTVKVSQPPVVTATAPSDAATVADPTPAFTFTFTSPAGKTMAMHTFRLYRRVSGIDSLVYERDVLDDATTVTGPYFLLADATTYAWQVDGYDTDGLVGSTARRTFTTAFAAPEAVTSLTATADAQRGWIALAWTPSVATYLGFHVVRWRDADGQFRRVDLGPRATDDGRTELVGGAFTFRGGRLGSNVFQVTAHDGYQESDPEEVSVTLLPARGGAWMLKVDDERGLSWPVDPSGAPRTPQATVETFRPPGRPFPVHFHWGVSGRSASVRLRYLPSEAALARAVVAMLHAGTPVWLAAPEPYDWDVMRARVVRAGPEDPQQYGWVDLSIDLDEIAPEAPA